MTAMISVDNVSKHYHLGEARHTMIRDALMSRLRPWKPKKKPEVKKALDGLSLEIKQGEVVGLIGRNGAGKSTLLKVLSRITWPTSGKVSVNGRVASLLEVGTGFHDELTGRENVYMNGSILGMKKREIDASLEQIVDFADIGGFLDTPIKRYSSGMRMRLGFSVAAHLRTDVLFVDEVLAVGDAAFQKKCLGVMRELSDTGRTVVFVSHNSAAVENLCTRAVWIGEGKLQQDGPVGDVLRDYLNSFGAMQQKSLDVSAVKERRGTGAVRIQKMQILDPNGEEKSIVRSGDSLSIRLRYQCQREIPNLHFGVRIHSHLGVLLTDVHTWSTNQAVPLAAKGDGCVEVGIQGLNLMPGNYYLSVWASSLDEWHDVLENVAQLEVEPSDFYGTGRGVESRFGLMYFPFQWKEVPVGAAEASS